MCFFQRRHSRKHIFNGITWNNSAVFSHCIHFLIFAFIQSLQVPYCDVICSKYTSWGFFISAILSRILMHLFPTRSSWFNLLHTDEKQLMNFLYHWLKRASNNKSLMSTLEFASTSMTWKISLEVPLPYLRLVAIYHQELWLL